MRPWTHLRATERHCHMWSHGVTCLNSSQTTWYMVKYGDATVYLSAGSHSTHHKSYLCGWVFFSFAGRSFNTNSTSKFSSVSGWYSGQLVGLNPWICSMLGQLLLEWTINCRQVNHLPLVASKEYCWGSSQQYSHCSVSSNRTKLLNWNANLDASTANGFWVENFWTVWNHWNSDFMVIQRGNTKVWRSSFQFSLFHEMFKASSVHLCCFVVVFYIIK